MPRIVGGPDSSAIGAANLTRSPGRGYAKVESSDSMQYKIPLAFTPQPEGGYTVTLPLVPELVTEGDSFDEAMANVKDAALLAV